MIIVACFQAVSIVAVVFFLCRYHRDQLQGRDLILSGALASAMANHAVDADKWGSERRELLNRIQAPSHIPVTVPQDWEPSEDEDPDESALVNTIAYDDDFGTEDDLDAG